MRPLRLGPPLPLLLAALIIAASAGARAQEPTPPRPAPPAATAQADLDRLQGTWDCVSWINDGEHDPDRERGLESTYRGNQLTLKREGREYRHALVTLAPERTPRAMNIWDQDGPYADRTNRGIYELDGDTLKLCITLDPQADRPTEFVSAAGSSRLLLTYKRRRP